MCTEIVCNFIIYGDLINIVKYGSGHINDTYLVTYNQAGKPIKYIFRKINKKIFKKPENVIHNTVNVIKCIKRKLQELNQKLISQKVITLIRTIDGKNYYIDDSGDYWCAMLYFENAYTIDFIKNKEQAYAAAREYGKFQKYLIDEDLKKYKSTIPDFHNPYRRLESLKKIIKNDPFNRVKFAQDEIKYVLIKNRLINRLNEFILNKQLPLRITHNDTKINNVMLDKKTHKGVAVIDLDTVMPGYVIYDFGDLVRTAISPVAEDEKEISKVSLQTDFFDAVSCGYLQVLSEYLTSIEKENFVYGAELIIYEQAVRFLSDYLNGDVYYNIKYMEHNLTRARNQIALLKSVQEQKPLLQKIIKKYCLN